MNLYKIQLNGLGTHFVVASDPTTAYNQIRKTYDDADYGFAKERAMRTIELIAEAREYPENKVRLWLPPTSLGGNDATP